MVRDAEKYVDGEDEVIDFETIINEVALLRNRWLGIMKGLEAKQWQMGHIVKAKKSLYGRYSNRIKHGK